MANPGDTHIILGPPFHREWQGAAGHSIKAYVGGRVPFRVERRLHIVDDDSYILVNAGQDYAFCTPAASTLFNFTIFIADDDARDAWASMRSDEERLLDDPGCDSAPLPDFFVTPLRPTAAERRIRDDLMGLARQGALTPERRKAAASELVGHAMAAQSFALGQVRRVRASRPSTREETVRRVRRAIDLIEADFAAPLDLASLAAVACMARHHFLRRFKTVTGETPHQYILRRRFELAEQLLRESRLGVAEIGRCCGLGDASAFSAAFCHRYRMPPQRWRTAGQAGWPQGAPSRPAPTDRGR
jgi:AraC-like DNA-binding protein